jgi:hypothetical protein
MGLRFRKSFKIAPGVRLNVSNKSTGLSFGGKGLRYSINSRGRRTASIGIPGTGLSYVSTSSSSKPHRTQTYQQRNRLKEQARNLKNFEEKERAKYEVSMFQNQCELVKSIHKECDEPVYWSEIAISKPPFKKGERGPKEQLAVQKYEKHKIGFMDWLFRREEKVYSKLSEEIDQAKVVDLKEYQEWEELVALANRILEGDIDSYFQVIEEMDPLGDLAEFGSGFELGTDDPTMIEVEFDVHTDKIIPTTEKSLTKTGKLSQKQMTKTKFYDLSQDYVCSCVLRIAGDIFALLPLVKDVYIHAYDDALDPSTGHIERSLILSVKIDRSTFDLLNMERIDCSESMANFPYEMKFYKTKGFAPVTKVI